MKVNGIDLEELYEQLVDVAKYAEANGWVVKPVSYALYHLWKQVDEYEKSRKQDGGQEKEVKCKDCKNGIAESSCIWCYKHHMPCGENYHCSNGERKEGEQDDD